MQSLRPYYCATRWRLSHGEGRFRSIRIHVVGECEKLYNEKARVENEAETRKRERMRERERERLNERERERKQKLEST